MQWSTGYVVQTIHTGLQVGNWMFRNHFDSHAIRKINMPYKTNTYIMPKKDAFTSNLLASLGRHTTQIIHNQQLKDLKSSCGHIQNAIFYYNHDKLSRFQSCIEKSFDKAMDARANMGTDPNYLLGIYNNLIFTGFWYTAWDKHEIDLQLDCMSGLHFIYDQLQRMNQEPLFLEYIEKYQKKFQNPNGLIIDSDEKLYYDNLRKFGFDTNEFINNIQTISVRHVKNTNSHLNEPHSEIDKLFHHLNYDSDYHDLEYLKQDYWLPDPDKYIYFSVKPLILSSTKQHSGYDLSNGNFIVKKCKHMLMSISKNLFKPFLAGIYKPLLIFASIIAIGVFMDTYMIIVRNPISILHD